MELIQTDFPEPVAPAIKPCGILRKSIVTGFPVKSRPSAASSGESESRNEALFVTSDKRTARDTRLGISIPIELFPGIGACIRMSLQLKPVLNHLLNYEFYLPLYHD